MAKVLVNYNCGCKYKTQNLEEAVAHTEQTGHTMSVLGTVEPDVKPRKER